MRFSAVTRRMFLNAAATIPLIGPNRAHAGVPLEEEEISPHHGRPRILVYPGHDHGSWGVPRLQSVEEDLPGVGLYHYNLRRVWVSDLDQLALRLQEHLRRGLVVLVGYSKGACAALDVVVNAELTEEMISRLHLLLVAPAAKVRGIPEVFLPSCVDVWSQRWRDAELALREHIAQRRPSWCSLLEHRVRMMYSLDDSLIDPRGHERLRSWIPKEHVREFAGLRKHLSWLRRKELAGEVIDILGEATERQPRDSTIGGESNHRAE